MPRLLDWPVGIGMTLVEPQAGPRSQGATGNERADAAIQTSASAFSLRMWKFAIRPLHKVGYRRFEGFITALHASSNAVRLQIPAPDNLTLEEAGLVADFQSLAAQMKSTSNYGLAGLSGCNYGYPVVPVASDASKGDVFIRLASDFWGATLGIGDRIGFNPLHFGSYSITEVFSDGLYRIWPSLEKNITTDDVATLTPVIATRLTSDSAATFQRTPSAAENITLTMVEVPQSTLDAYYSQ